MSKLIQLCGVFVLMATLGSVAHAQMQADYKPCGRRVNLRGARSSRRVALKQSLSERRADAELNLVKRLPKTKKRISGARAYHPLLTARRVTVRRKLRAQFPSPEYE